MKWIGDTTPKRKEFRQAKDEEIQKPSKSRKAHKPFVLEYRVTDAFKELFQPDSVEFMFEQRPYKGWTVWGRYVKFRDAENARLDCEKKCLTDKTGEIPKFEYRVVGMP